MPLMRDSTRMPMQDDEKMALHDMLLVTADRAEE